MPVRKLLPLLLVLAAASSSCADGAGLGTTTSTSAGTLPTVSSPTSTTGTSDAATTATSTSTSHAVSIPRGHYAGRVQLAVPPDTPIYEVLDGSLSLDVTADQIRADLDLTTRASVRVSDDRPTCTATVARSYHGRASPANPLTIVMELRGQQIILLEGPQCGVVAGVYDTTVAAELAIEFAEDRPHPMTGSFRDGSFDGVFLDVLAATADLQG